MTSHPTPLLDPLEGLPPDVQRLLTASVGTTSVAQAQTALRGLPVEEPGARQLLAEKNPLNPEQMAVVEAVVEHRHDVVVRAKAGTGKTTTLEALARRIQIARPGSRILYLAFSKGIQIEASSRMPSNVESRTGHSLAWSFVGPGLWGKIGRDQLARYEPEIAASDELRYLRTKPKAIARAMGISIHEAEVVKDAVAFYANSEDDEVSLEHIEAVCALAPSDLTDRQKRTLLGRAREYFDDVSSPLGSGACRFMPTQDHLRKIWALSRPDFTTSTYGGRPADVLFLDEAQDTVSAVARVISEQPPQVQRVVVGDPQQAIYGFASTIDYFDQVTIDTELPLTTSYRFGPNIAATANRFLAELRSPEFVIGARESDTVGPLHAPAAVLTRTNAGMITEIASEAAKGRRVGLLAATHDDLSALVATTAHMRDGAAAPRVKHQVLKRYDTWAEVKAEAAASAKTSELNIALQIVTK